MCLAAERRGRKPTTRKKIRTLVGGDDLFEALETPHEELLGRAVVRGAILNHVQVCAQIPGLGVLVASHQIVQRFDGLRFHQPSGGRVNPEDPVDPFRVAQPLSQLQRVGVAPTNSASGSSFSESLNG